MSKSVFAKGEKMVAKFIVFKDGAGQYRFRLVNSSGEIIAASEPFFSRQSCRSGIDALRTLAPAAEIDDETLPKQPGR